MKSRSLPPHAHRRRFLRLSVLLLAIIARSSRAQDAPPNNTIHGVVINSVTREPVGRALVFSPDNRLATLADDQGRFEFVFPQSAPDPAANSTEQQAAASAAQLFSGSFFNYALMARKPGFLSSQNRFGPFQPTVVKGNELTVTLIPEALIVGRVTLPSSNVADRIEVDLYRRQVQEGSAHWFHSASVTTRSNGEFRFADLEPGTYKVLTREQMDRDPLTFNPRGAQYGYPPAYFPNGTDFLTAAAIQLTPGATFQAELSPVRQPYYPVKVPVTNATSDTQLMVSVSVQGHRGPGFSLGYNHGDRTIEGALPNGTYLIETTGVGPSPATGSTTITVKGAPLEAPPLTLAPLSTIRINAKLDFKSDPDMQAEKTSEVVPEGGQSARSNLNVRSNVNVRLEPADEFPTENNFLQLRPPTGPGDDSLVFDNVSPGRYWVRIDSPRGFAASITVGDLDLLRRPLTVGLGASLTIDVTLRDDGAEIDGSIEGVGANNTVMPDSATDGSIPVMSGLPGRIPAYVYCVPLADSPGQFRQASVPQDGKFNLQQVAPGAYRVLAFDSPQPELEYRNSESMRPYEAKGQVIRVVAGQKEDVALPLISTSDELPH